jgi:hypothetical protein
MYIDHTCPSSPSPFTLSLPLVTMPRQDLFCLPGLHYLKGILIV